jgi:hypothetical protein
VGFTFTVIHLKATEMALLRKRLFRRQVPEDHPPKTFGQADAEPPPDPWFDAYRIPATERARDVVRDIAGQLQALERYRELRQRKRRPEDQQRFEAIVTAVVSDVVHHYLSGRPGAGLVVTRSKKELAKRSRYRPPILTETFVTVLDLLASPEMQFITQDIGGRNQREARRTTIKAGPRLVTRINDHCLTFADLTLSESEEVILLKGKRRLKENGREDFFDRGDLIEYEDSPTTLRYRQEVEAINAWLKQAEIAFDKDTAKGGVVDPELIYDIDHVDTNARQLRRYFSRGSFQSGGRLFGGFWQQLERQSRLRGLRINGEPVVSLDYSQFNPMLAYSVIGHIPPAGDAYTIVGLERHRERVKRVFNSMMFATAPLKKFPKGLRTPTRSQDATSDNEPFPVRTKIEDVTSAITAKHPRLSDLFYSGAGHQMMFLESELMMRVLLSLREMAVVALPVFDAVVISERDEAKARSVMAEQFLTSTGLTATIKREQALRPVSFTLEPQDT